VNQSAHTAEPMAESRSQLAMDTPMIAELVAFLYGVAIHSSGCKNCYAERMSKRLRGRHGYPADEPFRVTLHEDKLTVPLHWRKPRTCFVCSMSDLFHPDVPFKFIDKVFAVMALSPQHTFQVLTKRPERMAEYTNQDHNDRYCRAIRHFEPRGMKWRNWPLPSVWLGTINHHIKAIYEDGELSPEATIRQYRIVQSEGARQVELDWFRSLRDQCCDAYVPFFMKQIDKKQPIPDDLMVREYPNA